MVDLTEKRIAVLTYADRHNGITLREASQGIYQHKSSASQSLKELEQKGYLNIITDTPITSSYNKLWIPTKKGQKIIEALDF